MYISVSPNPYDDSSNEDAFSQVFNPKIIPMEVIEDINQDNLYFLKSVKQIDSRKPTTFEDFDNFYKKLSDEEEIAEIEAGNYERPSFSINLSQEKIFSSFENEKYVNVVNSDNEIVRLLNSKFSKEEKIEKDFKNNKTKDSTGSNNINCIEKNEEKEGNKTTNENKEENINSVYSKDNNTIKKKKQEDFFPFTPGKGIIRCLKICDESFCTYNQTVNINSVSVSSQDNEGVDNSNGEENSLNTEQVENGNDNMLFKFTTKKYFINESGKKRRIKKIRKYKSDDIRKKIKSRFHKILKNLINDNLKKAGSKQLFDFLPQCFIGNVSKKTNSYCLELTLNEILTTDFTSETKEKYPNKNVDYKKFVKNKKVLEYLEKNPEISKKSGFDSFKNKKYKDLLGIFFNSGEFEDSVIRLKKENETKDYIQEYVLKAKNYVKFYSNYGKAGNKEENNAEEN